jgi:hypothetical protein
VQLRLAQCLQHCSRESTKAFGGSFTPSEWSPDLANKAQAWANTIATQCSNGVPVYGSNPKDYGVNTILNVANPDVDVVRIMMLVLTFYSYFKHWYWYSCYDQLLHSSSLKELPGKQW